MKDAEKVGELEKRIQELEKQVEGASIFLSGIAPLLELMGIGAIQSGKLTEGSQFVTFANLLKNPENCPKLFEKAIEMKEAIKVLSEILEKEVKKVL